ncbi:MAG TPA: glycosyltransferase N-terminal domain-containing protein [Chthoniobacterales bacterium]|nr:glycosyltransferase N-terminal domain-containing protein [Chthoniobacterales bacterium]
MIRFLYNLFYPIGLLFFLPGQISKLVRRGNYRHKFGQRFGFYDREVRRRLASRRCTWMHAVSVGEVAVALKLAARLRELDQDFFCALTTTTTTGFQVATAGRSEDLEVLYSPLDFWPIIRRAFAVIRPVRITLVEAEVWPNLAAEARSRRIPLVLVNARLSRRSEARFLRFGFLVRPTFACLDAVCVQEAEDIQRWVTLGVSRQGIYHVGSIKYDPGEVKIQLDAPLAVLRDLGIAGDTPILFGGSTHPDEEEILARIFQELRPEFPSLRLVIAPRHVERTRDIQARLERMGLKVRLRSDAIETPAAAPDCLVIDTTGELPSWYAVATVVFIGKSLAARGGQNPVEPLLAGKPVLFGPHMENFAALATALLAHHAAVQVRDAAHLREEIARLLRDPGAAAAMVTNATAVLSQHSGATQRTAEIIMRPSSTHAADPAASSLGK